MLNIPRVALFKPTKEITQEISELLQAHEYSLRAVTEPEQIVELRQEEGANFDAIIMPLQLEDGTSGVSRCSQLKSTKELHQIPLVGLSPSQDSSLLRSFYDAGADYVLTAPYNADSLFFQVGALARINRKHTELMSANVRNSGLNHPISSAFNSIREGILIFDPRGHIYFANTAARLMLGIHKDAQDFLTVSKQLALYLKEHRNTASLTSDAEIKKPSNFEVELTRSDDRSFNASLLVTMLGSSNNILGYSVSITDLSEVEHLTNTILQAQRTRTLCLTTTAASVSFLENVYEDVIISPLRYIQEFLCKAKRKCPLDAAVTCLLESLDLVINPNIVIKVNVTQDLNLAVTPPDFFQLVGQIILHAVEHAGTKGEVTVETSTNVPGKGVLHTVTAQCHKVTPFPVEDRLSSLIQSDLSSFDESESRSGFNVGLSSAQAVADKYRTEILYQKDEDTNTIRIRVGLPASGAD